GRGARTGRATDLVEASQRPRLDDGAPRGLPRHARYSWRGTAAPGGRPRVPAGGSPQGPRTHGAGCPVREDRSPCRVAGAAMTSFTTQPPQATAAAAGTGYA